MFGREVSYSCKMPMIEVSDVYCLCNISHICNYSSSQYHALPMSVMKELWLLSDCHRTFIKKLELEKEAIGVRKILQHGSLLVNTFQSLCYIKM